MAWEPWVSAAGAAVSAVCAVVSTWQAGRSKEHEANATRAAQGQTRAIEKQEAREQGRLYLEKIGPLELRVWNPGFEDINRIELESISLVNHSTALGPINPGEFRDITLRFVDSTFDEMRVLLYRQDKTNPDIPDRHSYSLGAIGFTASTKRMRRRR